MKMDASPGRHRAARHPALVCTFGKPATGNHAPVSDRPDFNCQTKAIKQRVRLGDPGEESLPTNQLIGHARRRDPMDDEVGMDDSSCLLQLTIP